MSAHIITLSDNNIQARKHHRCIHCRGWIAPKTIYRRATYKYDYVYTFKTHLDCDDLYAAWLKFHDLKYYDFDDGYPPLIDAWSDGDFEADCTSFRGAFPHAVTRMECSKQLSSARYERWEADQVKKDQPNEQ